MAPIAPPQAPADKRLDGSVSHVLLAMLPMSGGGSRPRSTRRPYTPLYNPLRPAGAADEAYLRPLHSDFTERLRPHPYIPPPVKINVITAPNWRLSAPTNLWGSSKRLIPGLWAPWRRWACPSGLHLLDVTRPARPPWSSPAGACGAMALRGVVARRRLGTRLGLAGGGPIAFALPAHARAAGTQNPGRVCPQEPFQQP